MRISSLARIWLLAAPSLAVVAAVPALAQLHPPNDSNMNFGGMLAKRPPAVAAPAVAAPPTAWPRLEPGAVLCRSEDDLQRHAAIMRGEQADPADCRMIPQPTPIHIVHRAGLGRTEVQITGHTETAWTDAWLPTTPPPGATPVAADRPVGASPASGR